MADAKAWERETDWRQGSVLPQAAVAHFGLENDRDAAATCVVVISHDCDLANDDLSAEPRVEAIVGRTVAAIDGNFAWAKAPRTLHVTAKRADQALTIELLATRKVTLPKEQLAAFEPEASIRLDSTEVLQSWLSSRYRRAAFADRFVNRMGKTKATEKLAKIVEKYGATLSFVYFTVDAGEIVERDAGDPYELSIVLVYPPGKDPDASGDIADEAATEVDKALRECFDNDKQLILEKCFALSEDDLPVSKARGLQQWRLEHMTFRAKDPQPAPPSE